MKKNIALVVGGYSGEAVVSVRSGEQVEQNISSEKYNVYKIILSKEHWTYHDASGKTHEVDKNDFSLTLEKGKVKFDLAFIIIHGTPGEDGKLQAYFEMLDIPYTSCDSISSALTFNKAFCNAVVRETTLVNVSKSMHFYKKQNYAIPDIAKEIGFPCFVKPNAGGSSIGMSKVKSIDELQAAINKAFHEDDQVLIEQFIQGREFSCGVLEAAQQKIKLPITEIISKKEFFDYEAKYTTGFSEEVTPAPIPNDLRDLIHETSTKLYDKLGCFGVVRFDYIYNESAQKLFFLEVNTVPGQSANSIVPQQVRALGMTIPEFYQRLIDESLQRK